jgi:hypothetical protein
MVGQLTYRLVTYVILFAFALQGCGGQNKSIDPFLDTYYNKAVKELRKGGIHIKKQPTLIKFAERLDGTRIMGIARGMFNDEGIYIWISPAFLELSENQRLWVMLHELSHDAFNIKHQKSGIMGTHTPSYIGPATLKKNIEQLIELIKDER